MTTKFILFSAGVIIAGFIIGALVHDRTHRKPAEDTSAIWKAGIDYHTNIGDTVSMSVLHGTQTLVIIRRFSTSAEIVFDGKTNTVILK